MEPIWNESVKSGNPKTNVQTHVAPIPVADESKIPFEGLRPTRLITPASIPVPKNGNKNNANKGFMSISIMWSENIGDSI